MEARWRSPGGHALTHLAGAKFISPYYFTIMPDRFRMKAQHGVNAMELRPDNPKDGSDQFYKAIRQFAGY